jgi:uncharacterized protein DUF6056
MALAQQIEQIEWPQADPALTARRVLDPPPSRAARYAAWVGSTLLALPLASHASIGWFSRFVVDDYCMATASHRYGLLGSVSWWYRNWSGRWAHFLAVNLTEAVGRWTVRIIPGLLIALWVAAMAWAFVQAGRRLGVKRPAAGAILGAEALAVATLAGAREVFLSIYWRPGVIAYLVPWILLSFAAGLVIRAGADDGRRRATIAPALLAFVAGGFYETQTAMQIAILGILALCSIRMFSRRTRLALLAMLGASVAALAVLALAPGNDVRIGQLSGFVGPIETIRVAGRATGQFVAESFRVAPFALAVASIAGVGLGFVCVPRRRWAILAVPAATAGVIFAAMLPSAYTGFVYPVQRVLIIPQVVLVGGLALAGFLVGGMLAASPIRVDGRRAAAAGLAVLALAFVPPSMQAILANGDVAKGYAASVETRDGTLKQLKASGVRDATVDILPTPQRAWVGGLDATWERTNQVNVCIADYYGFDSLTARVTG